MQLQLEGREQLDGTAGRGGGKLLQETAQGNNWGILYSQATLLMVFCVEFWQLADCESLHFLASFPRSDQG